MAEFGTSYVKSFLEKCDLETYYERFLSQGFKDFLDICLITDNDLLELCIVDESHRERILSEVDKIDLKEWMKYHGLAKRACLSELKNAGFTNIKTLKQFPRVTEDILDEFNISLTGDRRRFKATVEMLKMSYEEESPKQGNLMVSEVVGYWCKPACVAESLCDFLCVKGTLKANNEDNSKESSELEFLVDSASDVVTVRDDIIKDLELAFKQQVTHCGIHTKTEDNLYRGVLKLGKNAIDVDIIAGGYESLGTNVLRQFNHFITGSTHQWLASS